MLIYVVINRISLLACSFSLEFYFRQRFTGGKRFRTVLGKAPKLKSLDSEVVFELLVFWCKYCQSWWQLFWVSKFLHIYTVFNKRQLFYSKEKCFWMCWLISFCKHTMLGCMQISKCQQEAQNKRSCILLVSLTFGWNCIYINFY